MDPRNLSPRVADYEPVKEIQVIDPLTLRIVYKRLYSPAIGTWAMGILPEHLLNAEALRQEALRSGKDPAAIFHAPECIQPCTRRLRPVRFPGVAIRPGHLSRPFRGLLGGPRKLQDLRLPDHPGPADPGNGVLRRHRSTPTGCNPTRWSGSRATRATRASRAPPTATPTSATTCAASRSTTRGCAGRWPWRSTWTRSSASSSTTRASARPGLFSNRPTSTTTRSPRSPSTPTAARRLLAEAGWLPDAEGRLAKNGQRLQFTLITNSGNDIRKSILAIAQDAWKQIGIDVRTDLLEWSVFIQERVNKLDFDALILGWSMGIDPDLYQIWHSSQTGPHQLNFVGYRNPEADELIVKIRQEYDHDRLVDYCHRLHALIAAGPALHLSVRAASGRRCWTSASSSARPTRRAAAATAGSPRRRRATTCFTSTSGSSWPRCRGLINEFGIRKGKGGMELGRRKVEGGKKPARCGGMTPSFFISAFRIPTSAFKRS